MEGTAAPITDGSTVVADTGREVAARQGHASVESKLCIRTAGGIGNLRRVRGHIRHFGINDPCIGKVSIDLRSRAGVCARVLLAGQPGCGINDSCIGNASIDSLFRVRVYARVLLAHHAGFEIAGDRVRRGCRSAEVHRFVAHVGSDRVGNWRGGI
jgi:hypothetical protein